jgi:hypothetical protein
MARQTGKVKQTPAPRTTSEAEVNQVDKQVLGWLAAIAQKVYEISESYPAEPPEPPDLYPAGAVVTKHPGTAMNTPSPPKTPSPLRALSGVPSTAKPVGEPESPRQVRERQDAVLEDKREGRLIATIPITDVVRGLVNRGTQQAPVTRSELYRAGDQARVEKTVALEMTRRQTPRRKSSYIEVAVERHPPFSTISRLLSSLDELLSTHFAPPPPPGYFQEGGAPKYLDPMMLVQNFVWPPGPQKVRADLAPDFLAKTTAGTATLAQQTINALSKRVSEIKSYPAITNTMEGSKSIRA